MDKNCIFCKIAKKEIPKNFLYESEEVMSFYDINPETPVHILVVPKKHITDLKKLSELDKDWVWEIFQVINKLAKDEGISEKGYRVVLNNGKDSGRLLDHLHFHILGGKKLGPKITG